MGVLQDGEAACKAVQFAEKLVVGDTSKPCGGHSDIDETAQHRHDPLGEVLESVPFDGVGFSVDLEGRNSARVGMEERREDKGMVMAEVMAVNWAQWVMIGSVGKVDYDVKRKVARSEEGGGSEWEEEGRLWECAFCVESCGPER